MAWQGHPEYPFTPKTIDIDGNTYSFLDEGEGPVVVMMHGNPTWSFFYRNVVHQLKNRFRCIVPDHMGCGFSDKPQRYRYTLENHISNAQTLLDRLDVGDYSLIMHDWGGAIGMGLASQHWDRVKSLTVLNTAAFRSKKIPWRIALCRVPLLGRILVRGFNGFAWPATFMTTTTPMDDQTKAGYIAPYDSWRNRIATHEFVKDIPLKPRDYSYDTLHSVESFLTRFTEHPMQILWGGQDFCFNDHFYEGWTSRFPKAEKYYFENAGHYVLEDAREACLALIDAFVSKAWK